LHLLYNNGRLPDTVKSAVVIGSGPNGLAAAALLARDGYRVTVHEASSEYGGGTRSGELTLPGFVHDLCSSVHPMGPTSPCFEELSLTEHGLEWIQPDAVCAHPLDDGTAVVMERSLDGTARHLGRDGEGWRRIYEPFIEAWPRLRHDLFGPQLRLPRHPLLTAQFGLRALRSARELAESRFSGPRAKALFAGIAAHSVIALEAPASAAAGIMLGIAGHASGWAIPRGGAQRIADALVSVLRSFGGEVRTGLVVRSLPDAPLVFCDITPRQLLAIAGDRFPAPYRHALERYRYGPGVFKIDWALNQPIPWKASDCLRTATVHVGGTLPEIAEWERTYTGHPFVLVTQPSLFDPSRAPAGRHTAWGYCHVPNGSTRDMTEDIEGQVERFAPGFRAAILARRVSTPADLERRNANIIGGDIGGGAFDLRQMLIRPTWRLSRTPLRGVFLCSSSTPPGGGVHGMCGYNAVKAATSRGL
jgi:phytoene dehydrogenase-like protein